MHVVLGGYHVRDVEFVAAFDVDAAKVGLDLGKAIFAGQNNTIRFASVPELGDQRAAGPDASTVSASTTARPSRSRRPRPVDVAQVLRDAGADVLVSYLPGRLRAGAEVLRPGVPRRRRRRSSTPSRCSSPPTRSGPQKFTDAGVPIVGDDIKSQVGATIVHRILARLFEDRGMVLDRTYQLNVGGNMDFKNMLERERLESKKISKTQAVTSQIDNGIAADDVHIGPSDHVAWLEDRKWAYIRLEGRNFGDVPAQHRAQARGVGLPELGRRHHRRRALRQARPRPRHRRPAPRPIGLLHEVAAGAVPRQRRLPSRRGLLQRDHPDGLTSSTTTARWSLTPRSTTSLRSTVQPGATATWSIRARALAAGKVGGPATSSRPEPVRSGLSSLKSPMRIVDVHGVDDEELGLAFDRIDRQVGARDHRRPEATGDETALLVSPPSGQGDDLHVVEFDPREEGIAVAAALHAAGRTEHAAQSARRRHDGHRVDTTRPTHANVDLLEGQKIGIELCATPGDEVDVDHAVAPAAVLNVEGDNPHRGAAARFRPCPPTTPLHGTATRRHIRPAPSSRPTPLITAPTSRPRPTSSLLGDLKGKRVLELGCGGAQCSIAFAKQGATAIGVDFSAEQLAFARRLCERENVKVELRQGDVADLAFLRAESIDLAFSAFSFGYVDDLSRVFRQVHRVLKLNAFLVFSLPHPAYDMIDDDDPYEPMQIRRSYFDRSPIEYEWNGIPFTDYHHTLSDLFMALHRSSYRVDTILEPEPVISGPAEPVVARLVPVRTPHTDRARPAKRATDSQLRRRPALRRRSRRAQRSRRRR